MEIIRTTGIKSYVTAETCLRGSIALICLLGFVSEIPFLMEHALSTAAPEHLFSNVAYDHVRPMMLFFYYAFHAFAYILFAYVVLLKPRDRTAGAIGLTVMLCMFLGKLSRYYVLTVMSENPSIEQLFRIIATLAICLVFIDYIVVLYMKSIRIRFALIGIGMFMSTVCMVSFSFIRGGSGEFFHYNHAAVPDCIDIWDFNSLAVVLTILAVGILYPLLLVCRESDDSETEDRLPVMSR